MARPTHMDASSAAGFSLVEMVCVIAIVAALAAIALPRLPLGTSRARLEAYAVEAAALLKADRTAALRRGRPVATTVDAPGRVLRSGDGRREVRLPKDVTMKAVLPQFCNDRPAGSAIAFFPSGLSCGGVVAFTRNGAGYEVKVNWLTGGVEIVQRRTS
ncbi:GspH/FimT family pseudopilin [Xanthobacter autotrophicus DSM 431]|uniref:prepilin-type N-terminal cleavage/methylation domain-containing protein n=1 Tax=Xanthobacter nonsaccharivorans TaxID=3119912 RepID=UPI0037267F2F